MKRHRFPLVLLLAALALSFIGCQVSEPPLMGKVMVSVDIKGYEGYEKVVVLGKDSSGTASTDRLILEPAISSGELILPVGDWTIEADVMKGADMLASASIAVKVIPDTTVKAKIDIRNPEITLVADGRPLPATMSATRLGYTINLGIADYDAATTYKLYYDGAESTEFNHVDGVYSINAIDLEAGRHTFRVDGIKDGKTNTGKTYTLDVEDGLVLTQMPPKMNEDGNVVLSVKPSVEGVELPAGGSYTWKIWNSRTDETPVLSETRSESTLNWTPAKNRTDGEFSIQVDYISGDYKASTTRCVHYFLPRFEVAKPDEIIAGDTCKLSIVDALSVVDPDAYTFEWKLNGKVIDGVSGPEATILASQEGLNNIEISYHAKADRFANKDVLEAEFKVLSDRYPILLRISNSIAPLEGDDWLNAASFAIKAVSASGDVIEKTVTDISGDVVLENLKHGQTYEITVDALNADASIIGTGTASAKSGDPTANIRIIERKDNGKISVVFNGLGADAAPSVKYGTSVVEMTYNAGAWKGLLEVPAGKGTLEVAAAGSSRTIDVRVVSGRTTDIAIAVGSVGIEIENSITKTPEIVISELQKWDPATRTFKLGVAVPGYENAEFTWKLSGVVQKGKETTWQIPAGYSGYMYVNVVTKCGDLFVSGSYELKI